MLSRTAGFGQKRSLVTEGKIMNTKIWTWSELKSKSQGFWPVGHDVPAEILSDGIYETKTRASFVAGVERFFAPFKSTQPLVWSALTKLPRLEIIQNKKYPALIDIAATAGDHFVFIEPFDFSDDDEYWEGIFKYMPDFLQSYYTNFNGMRGSRSMPASPGNLPANSRKWQRLSNYAKEESINNKDLKNLKEDFVDLDNLFIFLKTDWDDLVFLDFNSPSKNIYAVPQKDFMGYFQLKDAAAVLDRLCAHVIAGSSEPCYLQPHHPSVSL